MSHTFTAKVERFDCNMGWHYVSVPADLCEPLKVFADRGLIAVTATVGSSSWPTSLLPMGDGTHFVALAAKIRKQEGIELGDEIEMSFELRQR